MHQKVIFKIAKQNWTNLFYSVNLNGKTFWLAKAAEMHYVYYSDYSDF